MKYLLDDSGLTWTEIDLDARPNGNEMAEALKQITGCWNTPYVYLGHKYIGGHDHIVTMNLSGYLGNVIQAIEDFERDEDDVWYEPNPRS